MRRVAGRVAGAVVVLGLPILMGCIQTPPAASRPSPLSLPAVKSPTAADYPLAAVVENERRADELASAARGMDERVLDLQARERSLLDRVTAMRHDAFLLPAEREARAAFLLSELGRVRQDIAAAYELRGTFERGRGRQINQAMLDRGRAETIVAGRIPEAAQ